MDKGVIKVKRKFRFKASAKDFVKSSASWGLIENCVSVARKPQGVAVRDTKDASRTTLYFTRSEWKAFVKGMKNGEFNV